LGFYSTRNGGKNIMIAEEDIQEAVDRSVEDTYSVWDSVGVSICNSVGDSVENSIAQELEERSL